MATELQENTTFSKQRPNYFNYHQSTVNPNLETTKVAQHLAL